VQSTLTMLAQVASGVLQSSSSGYATHQLAKAVLGLGAAGLRGIRCGCSSKCG
jgi:hypothetical protein